MVDFVLTERQLAMRKVARDFVEEEIKPIALTRDIIVDPRGVFPVDVFKKSFELGFHKLCIPKKYGGLELDCMTMYLIMEELGAGDSGFAISYLAHAVALGLAINLGTEEQREVFLRAVTEGEGGLIAVASYEPEAGSTWGLVSNEAVHKTTAVAEGDNWVLNGKKAWCTNAGTPLTKWYIIMARTDMSKVGWGSGSMFFVWPDTPGFRVGRAEDKMGERLSQQCELFLDGAKVPKEQLVGGIPGRIPSPQEERLCKVEGFVLFQGSCIGLARSAYEAALDYAKRRIIIGRPSIQLQLVAAKLTDMYINIEAARAFAWKAASYSDTHPQMDMRLSLGGKILASDVAVRVTSDALQIWGAAGYTKRTLVEKLCRDARVTQIEDGANDLFRDAVSRML